MSQARVSEYQGNQGVWDIFVTLDCVHFTQLPLISVKIRLVPFQDFDLKVVDQHILT